MKKDLNTWASVESLFERLNEDQLKKLQIEIEIIENIKKNITLSYLREVFILLNINFTKTKVTTWNKACSFLRTLNYEVIQKILDIIMIIYPYLEYPSLSKLEDLARQLRIAHTKNDFISRESSKKWSISLSRENLNSLVKELIIDDIFHSCDNRNEFEKILYYEFKKRKKVQSWEEARIYLSNEFSLDELENLEMNYYEIIYDLEESSGIIKEVDFEQRIKIFFSYSTKDKERFKIPQIAKKLDEEPNISVFYYDRDANENIITYMTEGLRECDILLLYCSENSDESESVKDEWTAAYKKKKKILPIFIEESHIPDLISTRRGVKFNESNLQKTIDEIKKIIIIKAQELESK